MDMSPKSGGSVSCCNYFYIVGPKHLAARRTNNPLQKAGHAYARAQSASKFLFILEFMQPRLNCSGG
ncbi:MAG: hypothetical protein NTZ90_16745 [Proteobacteria bacterium]|nr:hypothetical protein [Pseudomonadota bacterium]